MTMPSETMPRPFSGAMLAPSRKYAMRSLRFEIVQRLAAERLDLRAREVIVLRTEDHADRLVVAFEPRRRERRRAALRSR